ncbi:glycerol-3-phosphate dehydrogenase/oxidase [uncultured Kocuria sp.]|uniref:glycerol-3-phosphate dehydrogenase/oxidase n=1 Tax=uncultured Kocuria sp. TaxID=259305 RepID=UPI0025995F18|nr:glycerol-3-phosphate dehydrogenase/oxidase [uncultured Kocuria sp.]MCT1367797.1 glycerol-3-phosphate dehydrogenase/oxidase [Rothia sp. p3-SID1597]
MKTAATHLTAASRAEALDAMSDSEGVDILVVGGGVTGAGIALDAATRGLRTAVVDAGDWASGTSAWSSKLVHGGLRYLLNLDFKLVAEALKERGLLLTSLAPHLVKAQPFLWPLKMPVIERSYSAIGIGMYDAMAIAGARGKKTVPTQKHYSKKGAKQLFPDIKDDALTGAIRFYDARVDDARLVIDLIRTAAGYGALAASRAQVTGLLKSETGRVIGAKVTDLETQEVREVRAKHVINATGVWTEETESLTGKEQGLEVLASKGVHIVVPRERINAESGIFLRTEKSVLFIIPWQRYWVIGTTDTPYDQDVARPVATAQDIDYILDHANAILDKPLTRDDIISTYAGLRPLLQPGVKGDESTQSTKVSREHTVAEVVPGMSAIAGGKLTTYRIMARDAVDFALGATAGARPSITEDIPLVGAQGYQAARTRAGQIAEQFGWTAARVDSLLDRYGSEIDDVLDLIREDSELGKPLTNAPMFLRAEVLLAVRYEGALHLEDVLMRRVRLDLEQRDRGLSSAEEILAIMSPELGWSAEDRKREFDNYAQRVSNIARAEEENDDAGASQSVTADPEIMPRKILGKN